MERAKAYLILFLTIVSLSVLLIACSAEAPDETPEVPTAAPDEDGDTEPDSTPEDEIKAM